MTDTYIHKRGEWWHYRRKVPKVIAHLDNRKEVTATLGTKDKSKALIKAEIYSTHFENYWHSLIETDTAQTTDEKYQAAVALAKAHGFAYKTTEQIAVSSMNELLRRFKVDFRSQQDVEAILGTAETPQIMLSECWQLFTEIAVDRHRDKADRQVRKWENPRKLALEEFLAIVEDKAMGELERQDALDYRQWLLEQIQEGHISGETGNKKLSHLKDVLRTVAVQKKVSLEPDELFVSLRFEYKEQSRPPFEASYVQDVLLPGLHKMKNKAYQMVVYVMADTGAREAEIFGLLPDDIKLTDTVPHIHIRPRKGYTLKTETSARKIPLVGTALYAFQKFPDGFHRLGNPDTFSTTVNKYLRENNLKPTPEHSLYSLRHTFKDRLRDVGAPEELIDGLMGHKKKGPQYGRGHRLDTEHKWLSSIAYKI